MRVQAFATTTWLELTRTEPHFLKVTCFGGHLEVPQPYAATLVFTCEDTAERKQTLACDT
jgi:hypothetical protein